MRISDWSSDVCSSDLTAAHFLRPNRMGEFVEHAIDELVAVLGAEHLGEIDRLIDGNLPWHVRAMLQFIGGEQQDRMFDRLDLSDRAIVMRRDHQRQLGRMLDDTVKYFLDVDRKSVVSGPRDSVQVALGEGR